MAERVWRRQDDDRCSTVSAITAKLSKPATRAGASSTELNRRPACPGEQTGFSCDALGRTRECRVASRGSFPFATGKSLRQRRRVVPFPRRSGVSFACPLTRPARQRADRSDAGSCPRAAPATNGSTRYCRTRLGARPRSGELSQPLSAELPIRCWSLDRGSSARYIGHTVSTRASEYDELSL